MPNWEAVHADFLATGLPYPELAKKWEVSLSSLKKRAAKEKWTQQHAQAAAEPEPQGEPAPREEPEPVMLAYAAYTRSERERRLLRLTDDMIDRIIEALALIPPGDTKSFQELVRALKDIREMQGLHRTAADLEEQQERIEKLRREKLAAEKPESQGVVVEFIDTYGAEV